MNYAGYEELRADVAALSNEMCDLRTRLNGLESGWRQDSGSLPERLARLTVCRINALFLEAYKEALALDTAFQD